MVTRLDKNILLLKEIPSNLIEEVILILKTDDKKMKVKTREILMLEANEIIQNCSLKLQSEYDENRRKEREEAYRKRKQKINILSLLGFVLFTSLIISIVNMFS